nr:HIRAN domain-containing protein [Pirellula staleyi]
MTTCICSFCEKVINFPQEMLRKRGKCPRCQQVVLLVDNREQSLDSELRTLWYYRWNQLLLGMRMVGPIEDIDFLRLVQSGQITSSVEVMSPELTKGQWAPLSAIKLSVIEQNVQQRLAEQSRIQRNFIKRQQADAENRGKLQRAIRSALESGGLSTNHRKSIEEFGLAAGIPAHEIANYIAQQSNSLVREVFEDALSDGLLDQAEEQKIGQLAVALGVTLSFNADDRRRIVLCKLAHQIDHGSFQPATEILVPFKLAAKETALASTQVTWHEIVSLKKPQGIPLGGGFFLKHGGAGNAYLTTKQVSMVGALQSQKLGLSSVQRATRYVDGVFLNRSTGKSIFLEFDSLTEAGGSFALLLEYACSGDPVLGFDPTHQFVPQVVDAESIDVPEPSFSLDSPSSEPKYTFRVVGDHVGTRSHFIQQLQVGDPVLLIREPDNPFDACAVAVYDAQRRQLGYLKREVAEWFTHILSRQQVTSMVHAFTAAGSLVVGVYY